jgi:hypothetical protein
LVGGVALGFLALQAMSRVATGDAGPIGVVALVVFGLAWLVAPLIGWQKRLPAFAAGWSASGVVLAMGVIVQTMLAGAS